MEITLDLLLASRDRRWQHKRELLEKHPDLSLVCLTVVMPGNVKRNDLSLAVARAAVQAVNDTFGDKVAKLEQCDLETGFEAYILLHTPLREAKAAVCRIEETHPLGRLFDLDVIRRDGTPVTREEIGLEPRRCIICGNEARYCMRNHTHSTEELQQRIAQMVNEYVQRV